MSSSEDLLAATVACLERLGVRYAILGAVARNAWAPPRATSDLDLAIELEPPGYDQVVRALAAVGLTVERVVASDAGDTVPDIVLLRGDARYGLLNRLDLLVAKTPFQHESIARATTVDLGTLACAVVTPEDLLVYKLIAARRRDLDDAVDVARAVAARGEALDWAYVERWCREWGIAERLDALRAELRP